MVCRQIVEHRHQHGGGDDVPLIDVTEPDAEDGDGHLGRLEGVHPRRGRGRTLPAEDFWFVVPAGDTDQFGSQRLGRGSCTSTVTVLGVNRGMPATFCGCSVS